MNSIYDSDTRRGSGAIRIVPAVVTNICDKENLGRIKIKFLDFDTQEYETEYPIRMVTPMGGKEWGFLAPPHVGDEVLVVYSEDDLSHMYILGYLWNNNFKPPFQTDNENNIRLIKTRSGHEIRFDDTKDKEKINIKTPKSLFITIDDEKEQITISDKDKKNLVKIDSKNSNIKITAEKKITASSGSSQLILDGSSNNITLKCDGSMSIKAQKIDIKADTTVEVSAGSVATLKADGQAVVKGAITKIN